MCGRYAVSARPERLADQFDVIDIFEGLPDPDYNVAPTVSVPAVLERTVRTDTADGSATPGQVRRRLAPLTWGLVPSWAKDRSIGARLINARVESVAEKPAFRKAFASRRCLLPADGFYEWYTPDGHDADSPKGKAGRGRKQPFFLHRRDGGLLVMAGLYEIWRDPAKDREDESAWLRTCTVITTTATDAAGHIHDRMPMVVGRDAVDAWLDPTLTDPARVLGLLVSDAAELEAYAVSTEVNSVKNNGPQLLEPLPEDGALGAAEVPAQEPLV